MESIVNVTTPTLTAYLPDPAKATALPSLSPRVEAFSFSVRMRTRLRSGSQLSELLEAESHHRAGLSDV
jgi:hypothetical protein